VFVELDTCQDGLQGLPSSERDTGENQIVVADIRNPSRLVFLVPGVSADAFRDSFRYAR
jgi:hypothetical protein